MKNIHNHPSRITVLLSTSVILISYTVSLIGVASAAGANGLFGDYFVRMTGPCAAGSVLTGFSQTSGSYGTKTCTPLSNILGDSLGTLFSNSSSTAPTGQAVLGFNPDGTLNFGSVNWNNSGGNISYTEGNVGIGTTSPSNKLHVTGNIGATGWIGAGCEGACEGGGGYSLMYPDGNIVNTAKTTSATLGLANGFEIQQGGSNYGQFNSWVHLNGYHGFYSAYNSAHFYPNNAS